MKVHLVEDAKDWWRWWSTWLAAISAGLGGAAIGYSAMPLAWQSVFPEWMVQVLAVGSVVTAALIPFARVVQQPRKHHDSGT